MLDKKKFQRFLIKNRSIDILEMIRAGDFKIKFREEKLVMLFINAPEIKSIDEAIMISNEIGFPLVVRPAFGLQEIENLHNIAKERRKNHDSKTY